MIGKERKDRLLKHTKETAEFLGVQPISIDVSPILDDYIRAIDCCPIVLFFEEDLDEVYRNGWIENFIGERKQIYNFSDHLWWKKLSPYTRRSVIKWLNERIEKGLP